MSKLDPLARCPASGLLNVQCMGSICDCFPEEDDRFGIHPEYFQVVGSVTPEERQALTEYLEAEHGPVPPTFHQPDCSLPDRHEPPCHDARDDYLG